MINVIQVLFICTFSFSQMAIASECLVGNFSKSTLEQQMIRELRVDDVDIEFFANSWHAYNPFLWILDWERSFRIMSFSVTHKG